MGSRPALIAALLAAPLPAAARAPACVEADALHPSPVFVVVASNRPTVVERRLSIKEINLLRAVKPPPKTIAHGLSVADYRLTYTTQSEATRLKPGGAACAWLGGVVVNLTLDAIRIYIPKEYRPDSCESKQLLLHEREHEMLYRSGLEKTADKMRFALAHARNLPGPLTPIDAPSPEEAYARMKRQVDKVVRPIYEDFIKSVESQQESLDDPEAYRRLGASCSDWKRI